MQHFEQIGRDKEGENKEALGPGAEVLESLLEEDRRSTIHPTADTIGRIHQLDMEERREWAHTFDTAEEMMKRHLENTRTAIEAHPEEYSQPPQVWAETEITATSGGTELAVSIKAKGADGAVKNFDGATFSFTKSFSESANQSPEWQKQKTRFWMNTLGRGLVKIGASLGTRTFFSIPDEFSQKKSG